VRHLRPDRRRRGRGHRRRHRAGQGLRRRRCGPHLHRGPAHPRGVREVPRRRRHPPAGEHDRVRQVRAAVRTGAGGPRHER
ncbi:hypothetical protein KR215_004102, partial [Drosophila sulfurigaster]